MTNFPCTNLWFAVLGLTDECVLGLLIANQLFTKYGLCLLITQKMMIMNNLFKSIMVTSILLLSACATQTGWSPTVDPYGDPNAHRINQDYEECRQLALRASGGTTQEVAKGAFIGGLLGAATGAAIGAISGNPGAGAAYGAAIGGFGGGTKQGFESEDAYKRAYSNCMRHRGHYTVN
jgi:hypothetical protein